VKLLKGKRLKSVALAGNQPCFCWVYFLVDGPASVLTGGKSPRECSISGCVIALGRIHRLGLRNSARRKAGFRPRSCLGCWHNGFNRPVLKHGPRSLTCLRVFGWKTRARNESESQDPCRGEHWRPHLKFTDGCEVKHVCWDPKDGELCLNRVKPEETLVEARSDSDVQIDRRIWV
jgi:hypothetical protein